MNHQFKQKLEDLLKKDERFYKKEEDYFFKNKITECANNLDDKLIEFLLSDAECKKKFFKSHRAGKEKITLFDRESFIYWINHHEFLPDSYTKFKQNIGLSLDGNKYFKQTKEVSLIFPYKDCVLQGGQTKEDAKRNEIFYNETLAPDQVDRLLDKKVLRNFKRINQKGEQALSEIKEITQENLIVKGNNLLALHSLKHIYRGKVKLIYIDPPYNTGGDANIFTYNNSFNHSTWLTFMKNRLEIAKEFLKEDGFIAIAIDHYELFYLGILADEIFGRENRLGIVSITINPMGRQHAKFFSATNDYMLVYGKNNGLAKFNDVVINNEKQIFNQLDEDGKYKLNPFLHDHKKGSKIFKPNNFYPIYVNKNTLEIFLEEKENCFKLLPITKKGIERSWQNIIETAKEKIQKKEIIAKRNEKNEIELFYKFREQQRLFTVWNDKKYNANHHGVRLLERIIGNKSISFPKSLYTVLDTLKIMTEKDDIIMDFHAGSGTTGHAVLELNKEDGGNRKFILIEQLDEHIKICKERIQKVLQKHIEGEKEKETTLLNENKTKSLEELKAENYLSFELAEYNQKFVNQIQEAKTTDKLFVIYQEMEKNGFLSYQFNDKAFKEKQTDFKNLSIDQQKEILMDLLDKNMLYLNYEDIEDSKYGVDKKTIEFNKTIYQN